MLRFLIVAGTLVSVVWRIRWLLHVASREEESGGGTTARASHAEVPFIVNEIMIWFAMLLCAALRSGFLLAGLQMARA